MPNKDAATITVKGKEYDVNSDFSWRELATAEELAGQPLGAPGAFQSALVGAAFIFIVLKREDPALEWQTFLDTPVSDVAAEPEEAEGAGPPTKRASKRPAAAGTPS
jgi:hypothetical protein